MRAYEIDGMVPVVDPSAFVHDTAVLIGDVWVGPNCYIGPNAVLRGDFGRIIIGQGSNVQNNCVVHSYPHGDMVLEENSHIGHGATLHGCRIGSYAMVGINAVVLDGAEVGEEALLGANALLTMGKKIAPRMLALGSPAREVSELDEEMLAWKKNGVHVYQQLTERSRETMRHVIPYPKDDENRPRLFADNPPSTPPHRRKDRG